MEEKKVMVGIIIAVLMVILVACSVGSSSSSSSRRSSYSNYSTHDRKYSDDEIKNFVNDYKGTLGW